MEYGSFLFKKYFLQTLVGEKLDKSLYFLLLSWMKTETIIYM